MSAKSFLDTNIFIYGYDSRDPVKQSIADNLVRSLAIDAEAVISYQVVQEFFNWALVKGPVKMLHGDAQQYLATTFRPLRIVPASFALVSDAIRIRTATASAGTTASSSPPRNTPAATFSTPMTSSTASSSAPSPSGIRSSNGLCQRGPTSTPPRSPRCGRTPHMARPSPSESSPERHSPSHLPPSQTASAQSPEPGFP